MKKIMLALCLMVGASGAMAQQKLAFPYQGGKTVMAKFFKDSLTVSPDIVKKKAVGSVVLKFTANEYGEVKKIIIYFADDAILVKPVIEALRKSDRKWVVPDGEKMHDFILPFSISFNAAATGNEKAQQALFNYYANRHPIMSLDQIPLEMATLLPTVAVSYDLK